MGLISYTLVSSPEILSELLIRVESQIFISSNLINLRLLLFSAFIEQFILFLFLKGILVSKPGFSDGSEYQLTA
jgi:hypothetical protein